MIGKEVEMDWNEASTTGNERKLGLMRVGNWLQLA